MTLDQAEALVDATLARLPTWAREEMRNVEVIVADEPTADLDPDGERPLGLYLGTPLPEREANFAGELPDVIYIFLNPHLEHVDRPDRLEAELQTTLIHEVAHYFGIDDDHLDKIGWG